MKKISNSGFWFLIALVVVGIVSGGFLFSKHARASISSVTVTPSISGTDDVAGYSADYDISYTTDSTGSANTFTVTFPSDYAIDSFLFGGAANYVKSSIGTPGFITINGVELDVLNVDLSGQSIIITLVSPYDYGAFTPGVADTVEFTLTLGITNPTTAGVQTASGFSVVDNASGNTSQQSTNDVTIIPGQASSLDFTTLPSYTPTPTGGDILSGTNWTTGPIVTAYDRYGNVATSYNGDVVAIGIGSTGSGTLQYGISSPDLCSGVAPGTFQVAAVNGVADFSAVAISYTATADHEPFTLFATHTCGSNGGSLGGPGESSSITADVVANALSWSVDPATCVSGSACTTQGTIQAVNGSIVDLDYTDTVTVGEDGPGTLFGSASQGAMVAGALTTSGIGYTLQNVATPETIHFTADSGSLTQAVSGGVSITASTSEAVPPPTAPSSIGAGYTHNPNDIPYSELIPDTNNQDQNTCTPYLTAYLRVGASGEQVTKLQSFLSAHGFLQQTPTGFFGEMTKQAVIRFQEHYAQDVLTYWGITKGTGYEYITTQKKINQLSCANQ